MKTTMLSAVLVMTISNASAATFVVLPDLEQYPFPVPEAYVLTTDSETWITQIRTLITENERASPRVRIAAGADGVNVNHLAAGTPAWNWHVVEILELLPAGGIELPVEVPTRDTPLSVIDEDVAGFIAEHGNVIAPRRHVRLVEIDPDDLGHMVNVSNRGILGTGENVLICGLIVRGSTPRLVLMRALGPTLEDFGVSGAASDPALRLYRGSTLIAENDNWQDQPRPELIEALPSHLHPGNPAEAALVVILEPGATPSMVVRPRARGSVCWKPTT